MVYLMARTFSISLMLPLSLFFFIVFLLIDRQIHIQILSTLTFHHFQFYPWDPFPKEKKEKEIFLKVQFGALSIPGAQSFKESKILSHHPWQKSSVVEGYTSQASFLQSLRVLFNDFLSRLLLFWRLRVMIVTKAFYGSPQLLVGSHQYHCKA